MATDTDGASSSPLPRATEPEADLLAALLETGLASLVTTDMIDGHYWVCDPTDTSITWCQWCGRHRVEVPDWIDHPQCPAFAKVQNVIKARASSAPPLVRPLFLSNRLHRAFNIVSRSEHGEPSLRVCAGDSCAVCKRIAIELDELLGAALRVRAER